MAGQDLMGVSPEARVGRRAEQKRRWDRENVLTCDCGAPMTRGAEHCRRCQSERDAERVRAKRSYIAACWATGMTMAEIAVGLDTTMGSVAMEIQRMRRLGWNVPNRRRSRRARMSDLGQSVASLRAGVRTRKQIEDALDVLIDHGFLTGWHRIDGRYLIGPDGSYSKQQASAWIDGAAAVGAGGTAIPALPPTPPLARSEPTPDTPSRGRA